MSWKTSRNNSGKWQQSKYYPKHPEKYVGDINDIVCMSRWEKEFNIFLDNNPNILQWSSETIAIPYVKPTTGRVHRYYPDYYIKYRDKNNQIHEIIVEVKPKNQTKPSTARRKKTKLQEDIQYAINVSGKQPNNFASIKDGNSIL